MLAPDRIIVVKLGGSHAASPRLADWIAAIVRGAGRIVLVPGGGPFADAVRSAQAAMGFSDKTAHRMALLAMEQYGLALAALDGRLVPAATEVEMSLALRGRRVPVWMPSRMASEAPDIVESWDVTSDSLAAWLAQRLQARRLVLIKQVDIDAASRVDELAARGVIDAALRGYLRESGIETAIVGPRALDASGDVLACGDAGARIEV